MFVQSKKGRRNERNIEGLLAKIADAKLYKKPQSCAEVTATEFCKSSKAAQKSRKQIVNWLKI